MIRLACPECKKDSYSASVETLRPCPYCGFCFSGKYGAEKRDAYSAQKEIPVTFSYKGQNLQARTVNFSENGLSIKILSIKISGNTILPAGDIMELNIGESLIKAQIMWVFNNPQSTNALIGLKILVGNLNLP